MLIYKKNPLPRFITKWISRKRVIFIKEYKGFLVDDELNVYNSRTKRECCKELKLDRHKVARILKKELANNYKYSFSYI